MALVNICFLLPLIYQDIRYKKIDLEVFIVFLFFVTLNNSGVIGIIISKVVKTELIYGTFFSWIKPYNNNFEWSTSVLIYYLFAISFVILGIFEIKDRLPGILKGISWIDLSVMISLSFNYTMYMFMILLSVSLLLIVVVGGVIALVRKESIKLVMPMLPYIAIVHVLINYMIRGTNS